MTSTATSIHHNAASKDSMAESTPNTMTTPAMPPFRSNLTFSICPKTAFEQADEMILQATNLRADIASLYARATELEEAAAGLCKTAQQDRNFIQTELDIVLEMYESILDDFKSNPKSEGALQKLILEVEEGTASLEDVERLGDALQRQRYGKQGPRDSPEDSDAEAQGLVLPAENEGKNLESDGTLGAQIPAEVKPTKRQRRRKRKSYISHFFTPDKRLQVDGAITSDSGADLSEMITEERAGDGAERTAWSGLNQEVGILHGNAITTGYTSFDDTFEGFGDDGSV